MKNWAAIRERYLRDNLQVRLGGLAADLRRIKSFSSQETSREVIESLIEESKYFIEWTAPEEGIATAGELVAIQIQLAFWQRQWEAVWRDPDRRRQVAVQSQIWSDRLMNLSGLLQD